MEKHITIDGQRVSEYQIRDLSDQVVCRMEYKGETIAEAAECVLGAGKGELFEAVRACTLGMAEFKAFLDNRS